MTAPVSAPDAATRSAHAPSRPRRVLMVCEWHLKYGAWLTAAMAEHGADVRLLTRDNDLEFGGEAGHAEPGTMARWVAATLPGAHRHLQLPGRVRDLRAVAPGAAHWVRLRRFRPDFVHLQDAVVQDMRLAAVAGARPGRYAVTVHDVDAHPGGVQRGARTRRLRRLLLANAGLVFVHAEPLRELLVERDGLTAPVVVVPHGTGMPTPRPLPRERELLFFGRVEPYKGIGDLLDAMGDVWDAVPETTLTIAGYGTLPEHPALADRRVRVRNEYVPETDVEPMVTAARCVVLPYREASQSGVGSRAKQYGRPLVVTEVGGLPDLVEGGGGIVVPPADPPALGRALVETLRDDATAERMAGAAAASAREAAWDRVAARTLEAYERHLVR